MFQLDKRVFIAIGLYLLWVGYYTVDSYMDDRASLIQEVDQVLMNGAMTLPIMLPEGFHRQNMGPDTVSPDKDWENIVQLSRLADTIELKFVYSLIRQGEKILFTASSATEEERRTKKGLVTYFMHYDDAPAELKVAFDTGKLQFAEYSDKWGAFRGVFVPLSSADGLRYVSAADVEISHVDSLLTNSLIGSLWDSVMFLLFIIPFIVAYHWQVLLSNKLLESKVADRTRELREKNDETQEILNSSNNIIVLTDGMRIHAANRAFLNLVGTTNLIDFEKRGLGFRDYISYYGDYEQSLIDLNNDEWLNHIPQLDVEKRLVSVTASEENVQTIFRIDVSPAGKRFVVSLTDVTQLTVKTEMYRNLATHDQLTGCYNRVYMDSALHDAISEVSRYETAISIAIFDIDNFKSFNDNYGHITGDMVLRNVSRLIDDSIRSSDVFARWGGEEFMLILTHSDVNVAMRVADKLRLLIADSSFSDVPIKVTVSIGVTQLTVDDTIKSAFERADKALYEAKESGRNRVVEN